MAHARPLALAALAVFALALLQLLAPCAAARAGGGGGVGLTRSSPPVSAHTPAVLTFNGFQRGESGGGASECDGKFHSDSERIVALSSGWLRLDGTRRCNRKIRITAAGGRSVVAKVVDDCDSSHGCDDNIVDSSQAVWDALGLDTDVGRVPVTWADA